MNKVSQQGAVGVTIQRPANSFIICKRTGITYAYESKAVWDKEKKQSRAKRHLIGKVDPETGEIVPTDGRGRKRSPYYDADAEPQNEMPRTAKELKEEVLRLRTENEMLKKRISR